MPRRGIHALLHAANPIHTRLERLGADPRVDRAAGFLDKVVGLLPKRGAAKDALSGTWLDHPVHPMLTDLPIGFWTSAMLLDFMPGAAHQDAARALIGAGVLCAIPTALTGAADWSDTEDRARRVGTVHAVANSGALVCYVASWDSRRRGKHTAGVALGFAGATLATVGGLLGGHLVAALGVGVDRAAFDDGPSDWTGVHDAAGLPEGASVATVDGRKVLLVRHETTVHAIAATCPHRGAPLGADDVEGDVVTCSWHGSQFCVTDGALVAGPSPTPIRSYEARIHDDRVEIRATVTNH